MKLKYKRVWQNVLKKLSRRSKNPNYQEKRQREKQRARGYSQNKNPKTADVHQKRPLEYLKLKITNQRKKLQNEKQTFMIYIPLQNNLKENHQLDKLKAMDILLMKI